MGNFPIYHLRKRGGNLLQTIIRKTEGNVDALRTELMQEFHLGEKEVSVNSLTKHVTLKGLRKVEVAQFLEQRGF
ncbi:MAG: hypothetical protein M1823_002489 [Watsoniomyces obsoletus]|nr:MAG: hypothetical protein M1823_002489 [Watsoniomyces obsoletus]